MVPERRAEVVSLHGKLPVHRAHAKGHDFGPALRHHRTEAPAQDSDAALQATLRCISERRLKNNSAFAMSRYRHQVINRNPLSISDDNPRIRNHMRDDTNNVSVRYPSGIDLEAAAATCKTGQVFDAQR